MCVYTLLQSIPFKIPNLVELVTIEWDGGWGKGGYSLLMKNLSTTFVRAHLQYLLVCKLLSADCQTLRGVL